MSKQSSLFTFMERSERDTVRAMDSINASKPAKTSKFKFNKPTSRLQLQANNTNENRTLNIIANKTSDSGTVKKAIDCVVISDEESSPLESVKVAKKVTVSSALDDDDDDDLFKDFKSNDLTSMKESTSATNQAKTMEDLYAKYGTPKANEKSKIDTLDIDKALNSNASYVVAMKKLDENMVRLKTSPNKTITTSKFKFNSRSKQTSETNQNTAKISNSTNFSTNTSFASNTTATVTSGAYSSSVSNSLSSSTTNLTANSTASTVNRFSPVTTATNTTSQNSASSTNSYRPEPPASISPVDISFKSNDSP